MQKIFVGDAREKLKTLPNESVDCICTSPSYYQQRFYGDKSEIGQEETLQLYLESLWQIFNECKRVLKSTGSCFIVLGDTYHKGKDDGWQCHKQLLMVPQRFAIGMQERNWILRNQICWNKLSSAVQPAKDRLSPGWEPVFFFTKSEDYFFDPYQIGEPLKANTIQRALYDLNRDESTVKDQVRANIRKRSAEKALSQAEPKAFPRDVWNVAVGMTRGDLFHTAIYPTELVKKILLCATKPNDVVLDPFLGSGTTMEVCREMKRNCIGIELNEKYLADIKKRLNLNEQLVNEAEIIK